LKRRPVAKRRVTGTSGKAAKLIASWDTKRAMYEKYVQPAPSNGPLCRIGTGTLGCLERLIAQHAVFDLSSAHSEVELHRHAVSPQPMMGKL
jgi:hypothetical protein